MHYLAFSAPCVGHKDESRAQNTRRVVDIINLIRQVAAAMHPFAVSTAAQWRKGRTNRKIHNFWYVISQCYRPGLRVTPSGCANIFVN